jgi:tripartite-type tricarboxylate transporter receptor subunit TctC
MPDVPTVAELYADFTMVQWYGLFAPAGTPEAVMTRLRTEVNKALALPEVKDRLRNAGGVEAWITTPEEFAAEIRAEFGRYGRLVKEVGAKVD